MKPTLIAATLVLLVILIAACGSPAPAAPTVAAPPVGEPTSPPTAVSLEPGKGGLAGQVPGAPARWSGEPVMIFAAPFTAVNGDDQGFYVLEPEAHPHVTLDGSGSFQLTGIEPGKYVLVVGPTARDGKLVMGEAGKPRVFTVTAGEMLQTGSLNLAE